MKAKKLTGRITVEVYTDGKGMARVLTQQDGSGCALFVGALEVVRSFSKGYLINQMMNSYEDEALRRLVQKTDSYSDVEEVEVADDFFTRKEGEDE